MHRSEKEKLRAALAQGSKGDLNYTFGKPSAAESNLSILGILPSQSLLATPGENDLICFL